MFCGCLFMLSFPTLSQNIATSTLTWVAERGTDLSTASTLDMKCSFITKNNTSVEWIQKKGEKRSEYEVTAVEGSWTDVSSNGAITYTLMRNGKPCKMTLERTGSGTFITMDFSKEGEYTSRYRFQIISVQ